MNEFLKANKELWDAWTELHKTSKFYDVKGFKRGKCTLQDIEREELGDVSGKSLLHLQCHFGLDTMSWARLGAEVTGVDFSPKAVALAMSLSAELNIPAEFICCNVYDLPEHLSGQFDIVYTSRGVTVWLPDLKKWAETTAHFLKRGGTFYIHEFHPFADIFADADTPIVHYPYFHSVDPIREEVTGSYAGAEPGVTRITHEWTHSIGDFINSLLGAGLRIEYLHELPYCMYPHRPFLTQHEDGLWRYDAAPDSIPLMFSIKARKE